MSLILLFQDLAWKASNTTSQEHRHTLKCFGNEYLRGGVISPLIIHTLAKKSIVKLMPSGFDYTIHYLL